MQSAHSCQRNARKVGLELGQSTSLPLACLEMDCRMGLDPLIDGCAVCRKQTQDEEALHCVSDDEVKIR